MPERRRSLTGQATRLAASAWTEFGIYSTSDSDDWREFQQIADSFTLTCWVFCETFGTNLWELTAQATNRAIITVSAPFNGGAGPVRPIVSLIRTTGGPSFPSSTTADIGADTWAFLALRWDSASSNLEHITLDQNGMQIGKTSDSINSGPLDFAAQGPYSLQFGNGRAGSDPHVSGSNYKAVYDWRAYREKLHDADLVKVSRDLFDDIEPVVSIPLDGPQSKTDLFGHPLGLNAQSGTITYPAAPYQPPTKPSRVFVPLLAAAPVVLKDAVGQLTTPHTIGGVTTPHTVGALS